MKFFFREDFKSSIVLYLVALPLCLGIALASKAPIISGVIAGIVGGIVVGLLSGSNTSVSGPAAGLTIIVITGLKDLPDYQAFLLAVVLAGGFQFILSQLKAGVLGDFIPGAVISGMLVSIGLLLVLKQIPHALGYDFDFEGDEEFLQEDGKNTFSEIYYAFIELNWGAFLIAVLSMFVLIGWGSEKLNKYGFFRLIPSQLIVVLLGIGINAIYINYFPNIALKGFHLSDVPKIDAETLAGWSFPDFTQIGNPMVWKLAITMAFVASIETLLSIQAGDKIDNYNRVTPANRELFAQGIGNVTSGFLGGLPITSVIVRTSANVNAGARTKWSTIFHGILLLMSVLVLTPFINLVPKAALAAILIHVGYKLSKPTIFKDEYKKKFNRFLPFIITIVAILLTDLLIGVIVGILVSLCFILVSNYKTSVMLYEDHGNFLLRFNKDVSFLNKKNIKKLLSTIPDNSKILIDSTKADFVDIDIIEAVDDFIDSAPNRNIKISVKTTPTKPQSLFKSI